MSAEIRVAVIGGGRSDEHDVSLSSAASAVRALRGTGRHEVVPLTVRRDGTWTDTQGLPMDAAEAVTVLRGCEIALPLMHGPHGEDGTLAGFLELAGVQYVGSGVGAGAIAMDKWVTKLVAEGLGIATAPGTLVTERTAADCRWTEPVVVKPVAAGSSIGASMVGRPEELGPALRKALGHGGRTLVERVVSGREVDVAVLGRPDGSHLVAPPLEIVSTGFFDYATKYGDQAPFRIPAPLDDVQHKALTIAATEMYDALQCRGVARVDFFVTAAGVVLNEVNTTPGLTESSQVPRMFASDGIAYPDLLSILIDDALLQPATTSA
ncbi:D-alanine--D-alanine ligase [Micromonospora ureilytica]|uniref:D-alanine--D-alanine ligase family protein n=1 Tax=Micromonospora ureilytica TaxID=709868 RepID=UPI0033C3DEBE